MPSLFATLEQTEKWYGQDGFPYRIEEMETSHLHNTLNFLRRRAQNIYERHQWHEHRLMERAPDEVFDEWMRNNMQAIASDPLEWLNNKPLIQAMEHQLKLRESITVEPLQLEGPNAGVMVRRD